MRRWLVAVSTFGVLGCVGVTAASARVAQGHAHHGARGHAHHGARGHAHRKDASALGYGSIQSLNTTNSFSFSARTTTNGAGGRGFITVFDPREHNWYNAKVTCLYVAPATGQTTVWGSVVSNNVTGGTWRSVVLNVRTGTDATAGFGNYLETFVAPTHCGPVTDDPPSPAITIGQILAHP